MSVESMTGFARVEGVSDAASWFFEVRSVNGKGLDLRLRLPPGFDSIEPKLRAAATAALKRGTLHVSLTLARRQGAVEVRLNEAVLSQVVAAARRAIELTGGSMPDTGEILAQRGVLEVVDAQAADLLSGDMAERLTADFETALVELKRARLAEGAGLATVIGAQIDELEQLILRIESAPARTPEAIRRRLGDLVARILEANDKFDADRLHQEAVLIATRVDVEEELQRLKSHVRAARELIAEGGQIGRRFDFLAQEFQREANTVCSKSNDAVITEAGLAMKVKIDQMREQVQNLE